MRIFGQFRHRVRKKIFKVPLKSPNLIKRRKKFLKTVLLILFLGLGLTSFLNSDFFKVGQIEISWDKEDFVTSTVESFVKAKLTGQKIFFIKSENLRFSPDELAAVKDFSLSKVYPSRLKVSISTRQAVLQVVSKKTPPVADLEKRLRSDQSGTPSAILKELFSNLARESDLTSYLVDEVGFVFWKSESIRLDLPKLFFLNDLNLGVGGKLPPGAPLSALKFLGQSAKLENLDGEVLLVSGESFFIVKSLNGPSILLPVSANYSELIDSLGLILKKYSLEGKTLRRIDLRFKNPVVEY